MSHSVDALWVVLDLVGGAFILWVPLIIDAATGGWYKLDNKTLYFQLEKASKEVPQAILMSTGIAMAR